MSKKGTRADAVSARMLKVTAPSVVPSVTKIFNLSLTTGRFPVAWKFARIVPIPKAGELTTLYIIDQFQSSQSQVNFWKEVHNRLSHHLHTLSLSLGFH